MNQNDFQVGDKVHCLLFGEGTVTGFRKNSEFPVIVQFNGKEDNYSKDGILLQGGKRTLYFEPVVAPKSAFVRPKKVLHKAGAILRFQSTHTEYIRELAEDFFEGDKIYAVKSEYRGFEQCHMHAQVLEVIRE